MFLLIVFCCGTPPSCLKVMGWVVVVVGGGLEQFSVSPRPLSFGFEAKGLGPGLDNFVRYLDTLELSYSILIRLGHKLN